MNSKGFNKLSFFCVPGNGYGATLRALAFVFVSFAFNTNCYAQEVSPASRLLAIKTATDSSTRQNPAEKIYIQFDKNTYTPGDTLWFKAYLFNAPTLNLSAKSGLIYINIIADSNQVIKRLRIPAENGISWGNVSLKDLPAGTYTFAAYTTWLQNFDQACFFHKQFTIADDAGNSWLANYTSSTTIADGKELAHVKFLLSDVYKNAVAQKTVQLAVMKGKKRLFHQTVQTDDKGLIDISFALPTNAGGLSVIAADANGNRVNIPLNFSRLQDADVQFMPEGGWLVAGLPAHIGFKAIGTDGKSINVSGVVIDHNKQPVADFKTLHLGMGSFDMQTKAGESYTARVILPGGGTRDYPLPVVKTDGIVLNVNNMSNGDSLRVSLAATEKIAGQNLNYLLIGKARGIVCYGAVFNFKNGNLISQKISKKLFPTGIVHFMLLDMKSNALNERLVFINRHDNLDIKANTDKTTYAPYDSIALHLNINDALGNPVAGNFSLAVTNDALIHPDSLNGENIITRVLLTSELKGYVEQPDYYLNTPADQSSLPLDNLLLTQGWVSYEWPDEKNRLVYAAETEFAIQGRVINVFNKPVKATKVSLLSKSPLLAADLLTDNNGHFMFHQLPVADTPAYVLKTAKNFNVSIVMDDARPPVFAAFSSSKTTPWYLNSDTSLFNNIKNNRVRQNLINDLPANAHALKEVKITAKKIVKGSQNLNGPGEADISFNETDMEKAGKQTWLSFLEEHVPGFRVSGINRPSDRNPIELAHFLAMKFSLEEKSLADAEASFVITPSENYNGYHFAAYFIEDKPIRIIVDGIALGSVFTSPYSDSPGLVDMRDYLTSHNAEDIKGLEIISSGKYTANYFNRYIHSDWKPNLSAADFAFIEITTRSGKGPGIGNTPGQYLYKPLALSLPAKFYKPRYAVGKSATSPDLRSTITWEPNIFAGADGKAAVWFFAADKPATYTLIIEGTNMDGSLGYKMQKVKIAGGVTMPPPGAGLSHAPR